MAKEERFPRLARDAAQAVGLPADYETEQLAYFAHVVSEADCFIDVGANKGVYAFLANSVMRGAEIYLIEADPTLAESLQTATLCWPDNSNNVSVLGVAASDANGKLPFYASEADTLGSLSRSKYNSSSMISVETSRLDSLVPSKGANTVTVIKVDVEGFEYRALRGAEKHLQSPLTRVVAELHGWGDPEAGKYPVHVAFLMAKYGFAIERIAGTFSYSFKKASLRRRTASCAIYLPYLFIKYVARRIGIRSLLDRVNAKL
ncbi:MAG: FkbM family methyltransferase [Pseudomonadota bacterium]